MLRLTLASNVDSDTLALELWSDDEMWGEIVQEADSASLVLYPNQANTPWRLNLAEVLEMLQEGQYQANRVFSET